jgi:hypothetical protein
MRDPEEREGVMKDQDLDRVLAFAAVDLETSVPDSFRMAIADTRAPLSRLIREFIENQPGFRFHEYLAAIADLNQGRLEDLGVPLFRSYIIGATGMDELVLNKCIDEISSYCRLQQMLAQRSSDLVMAARDDDGTGGDRISAADLLEQLAKRSQ